MIILITGGNGFVGRALVSKLLLINGCDTILMPTSSELDLLNEVLVDNYFRENKVDVVFHIAARLGGVGSVTSNPLFFLEQNLLLNLNVVKSAIKYKVKKLITFGSSCCYNNDINLPMRETDYWEKAPENTYGLCKLVLLEHLKAQNILNWVYLVPPNIYGPGDHFGSKDAHLIPATVLKFENAVKCGENYIDVWGDGRQIRDFVYIDDIVTALLESLTTDKYDRRVVNVSTGLGVSVEQIVLLIRKIMQLESIKICWDTAKPTGTLKKILSNNIFLELNPGYQFIKIEEGLTKTMDWYVREGSV